MKSRCFNKNSKSYKNYGERGITVCARWLKFEDFLEDMGRRPSLQHSLERKDNDKPYEPGNCLWVTAKDQARNRRSNHLVTYQGQTAPLASLVERFFPHEPMDRAHARISRRLERGWPVEKAFSVLVP